MHHIEDEKVDCQSHVVVLNDPKAQQNDEHEKYDDRWEHYHKVAPKKQL